MYGNSELNAFLIVLKIFIITNPQFPSYFADFLVDLAFIPVTFVKPRNNLKTRSYFPVSVMGEYLIVFPYRISVRDENPSLEIYLKFEKSNNRTSPKNNRPSALFDGVIQLSAFTIRIFTFVTVC